MKLLRITAEGLPLFKFYVSIYYLKNQMIYDKL